MDDGDPFLLEVLNDVHCVHRRLVPHEEGESERLWSIRWSRLHRLHHGAELLETRFGYIPPGDLVEAEVTASERQRNIY